MTIIEIISAVASLIGVAGALFAFFFIREERNKRQLENGSLAIEQFKAILEQQEAERQRLLAKCDKKSSEIERYRSLWEKERCVLTNCKMRVPPSEHKTPTTLYEVENGVRE